MLSSSFSCWMMPRGTYEIGNIPFKSCRNNLQWLTDWTFLWWYMPVTHFLSLEYALISLTNILQYDTHWNHCEAQYTIHTIIYCNFVPCNKYLKLILNCSDVCFWWQQRGWWRSCTYFNFTCNIITGRSMVISSMPRYPLPIITSVSPIYVYPFWIFQGMDFHSVISRSCKARIWIVVPIVSWKVGITLIFFSIYWHLVYPFFHFNIKIRDFFFFSCLQLFKHTVLT